MRKVFKEINRGASLNKCPKGCKKELGSVKEEKVEYECKRIWWTLWTNHRCKCTYSATVELKCVQVKKPKAEVEAEPEPQVAYLEEIREVQFTQIFMSLLMRFAFPLFSLCLFLFFFRNPLITR